MLEPPVAVRDPYKDRFVNGQVAGVIRVSVPFTLPRARWSSFVVSPQTLLRWHRELVRRKWTYARRSAGGRPPISEEVREIIVRIARENPRWGCLRIRGELLKLGVRVSATKIRAPSGQRARPGSSSWRPHLERVSQVPGSGDPGD
jgi:putative transposase